MVKTEIEYNKIELLTLCNLALAKSFFKQKFPFLQTKKYQQEIYNSFAIDTRNYQFQDSDGDTIFT
jgi:hypothetical protein